MNAFIDKCFYRAILHSTRRRIKQRHDWRDHIIKVVQRFIKMKKKKDVSAQHLRNRLFQILTR